MSNLKVNSYIGNGYSIEKSITDIDKNQRNIVNKELLGKFVETKDKKIADEIIKINIPIVLLSVERFGIRKYSDVYDDFVAEGLIELNNCIKNFNPKKGKFSTYAFKCIHFSLMHLVSKYEDQIKIPPRVKLKLKRLNDSLFLKNENQLSKKDNELLKLNFIYLNDNQDQDHLERNVFFNKTQYEDEKNSNEHKQDYYDILKICLETLTEKEQNVIGKYFGLNNQKQKNSNEIAIELRLTGARVRQIRDVALKKLKIRSEKLTL